MDMQNKTKDDLLKELEEEAKGLSDSEISEVLDFARFLKWKETRYDYTK